MSEWGSSAHHPPPYLGPGLEALQRTASHERLCGERPPKDNKDEQLSITVQYFSSKMSVDLYVTIFIMLHLRLSSLYIIWLHLLSED